MYQCSTVSIQTPNGFLLNGLLLNPNSNGNFFIFLHGLSGSIFSQIELMEKIAKNNNTVLTFNNRGNGIVSKIKKVDKKSKRGYVSETIGTAHEVFQDCVDDIEGAVNYAKKIGAKNIFLIGHSTGCQKSIYYLSKKKNSLIKGTVLLAPMSDFADTFAFTHKKIYNQAVSYCKNKVAQNKGHELLPANIWPYMLDAQRFLSLFTAESEEEIFSYASGKNPTTLKKVKQPILVILAEQDEYRDRPVKEIGDWFCKNLIKQEAKVELIKKANHGFAGLSENVLKVIINWSKK